MKNYMVNIEEEGMSGVGILDALRGMKNSLIIALSNAFICLIIGLLGTYTIVRFRTGGLNLAFWILSNRFLPPVAFVVPLFLLFKFMGLYGSRFSLIITYMVANVPFSIWILMGFLKEIPKELDEAALIDGASTLQLIFRVILPIISPGLVVVFLFMFIFCWNEYLLAFILSGSKWDTLAVVIPKTLFWIYLPRMASASLIGIIPGVIILIFTHRYLARGLTFGAIK
jgi:multiple sugar transport system permease protein